MSECPKCAQNIEITPNQFGSLFTCSFCQGVFFVDWDGNPEAGVEEEPIASETNLAEGHLTEGPTDQGYEAHSFEEPLAPMYETAAEPPSEQPTSEPAPPQAEPEPEPEPPQNPEQNFRENILNFANATEPQLLKSYKVTVQGLDLESEVLKLKEILRESQFRFDFERLIKSISHGKLVISDLTSIKAAILVHRLEMEHFELDVQQES